MEITSTEINFKQRSPEWYEARLGKLSSSRIKDIMGNPKKKGEILTQTAQTYLLSLIAETMRGQSKQLSAPALTWGTEQEDNALAHYEAETMQKVELCSFFVCDLLGAYGGSPDGLIKDGIIEIKCPYDSTNHLRTIIDGMPKEHNYQIQSNLLLTGRSFCDFISYDPRILSQPKQLYIQRIERDEEVISAILDKVKDFLSEMERILEGCFHSVVLLCV